MLPSISTTMKGKDTSAMLPPNSANKDLQVRGTFGREIQHWFSIWLGPVYIQTSIFLQMYASFKTQAKLFKTFYANNFLQKAALVIAKIIFNYKLQSNYNLHWRPYRLLYPVNFWLTKTPILHTESCNLKRELFNNRRQS